MRIRITLLAAAMAVASCKQAEEHQHEAAPSAKDGHAQHAHHESKHHKDPGPRMISLEQRLAERAAAARAIDWPDPAIGIETGVDLDGRHFSLVHVADPNTGEEHEETYMGMGYDEPRIRPDVISVLDLVEHRNDLRSVHDHADHAEHHHCAHALWARKPATRKIRLEWRMLLHYTARRLPGGKRHLAIDDVENVQVPTEADQEVIDCYTSMFRGNEVEDDWPTSPADLALADSEQGTFTWPVCINGDQMSAVTTAAANNN